MLPRLDGHGPLHRQLYIALRAQILAGELAPGTRLPSTRTLAGDLGLSRTTTLLAYDQLLAEGFLEGRVGSGTYVAETAALRQPGAASEAPLRPALRAAPAAADDAPAPPRLSKVGRRALTEVAPLLSSLRSRRLRPRYDFRVGRPAPDDLPLVRWRRILGRQARRADADLYDYPPAQGSVALRAALAAYLGRARGLACAAEQIVIVNGSQQGLDLAARILLDAGDAVLIEDPGYEGARSAFLLAGARLVGVPVDAQGLDVAAIGRAARSARLAYATPSHQYPTGAVLSLERRLALLRWADDTDAYVIEDDYDGEFRYTGRPIAPLKVLDAHGRVLYLGTLSKALFPALRLGYLVLPPALVPVFARTKALADGGTAGLGQEVLAELITSGTYERHLRHARVRVHERRDALLEAIDAHLGARAQVLGADSGLHVLLRLPGCTATQLESLVRRAADADVGVYPAAPYHLTPPVEPALVLGYAALRPAAIRIGIRRLAEIM